MNKITQNGVSPSASDVSPFSAEILQGLTSSPKYIPNKYFYDAAGDELFQALMKTPTYYLTACELEIFTQQTSTLIEHIVKRFGVGGEGSAAFDLIELGSGDATKSIHLLRGLLHRNINFTYVPIDISENIIKRLESTLREMFPSLRVAGLCGDYFKMLEAAAAAASPGTPRVVLFLGSTIGNMLGEEGARVFCSKLRSYMSGGDLAIIGFDLKKHPAVIRAAYSDNEGIERRFHLNLLSRINRELGGDFQETEFDHYCSYDPESGACKSYLVSLRDVEVRLGVEQKTRKIQFKKYESIWMNTSQKYTLEGIQRLAETTGFKGVGTLMDEKGWFAEAIWEAS